MNTESVAAIAEILLRLDERIEKLEIMLLEMKEGLAPQAFNQTPGRALQGWGRGTHQTRLGEL